MVFVFTEFWAFICVQDVFQNKRVDVELFAQFSNDLCLVQPVYGNPSCVWTGFRFADLPDVGDGFFLERGSIVLGEVNPDMFHGLLSDENQGARSESFGFSFVF